MQRSSAAAASAVTWSLALVFLLILDAAITRTQALWGMTTFANPRLGHEVFDQTYETLRTIYAAKKGPSKRVTLLGNSRLIVPTRPGSVEGELARIVPELDVRVDLLGVYGVGPVITELITRHLGQLETDLLVFTISGEDLRIPPDEQMKNPAYQLFNLGWRDGPVPPPSWSVRIDRWLRTSWRLWRFREFSRAAIEERILPPPYPASMPDHFGTSRDILAYARGEERADEIETAYQQWRRHPTLDRFVAYLELGHRRHLQAIDIRARQSPDDLVHEQENLETLDAIFKRFARAEWRTVVVLMPENPILDLDTKGEYHQLGRSDREATLISQSAERHGLSVVDGRRWMPAEAFMDFDHLWRDLSTFETPLAQEIANALGS